MIRKEIVKKSITNFVVTVKKYYFFLSRLLEDKLADWFHKITHRKVSEVTITTPPPIGKARLVPWEELDKSDDNNKPITSTGNITNSVTPEEPTKPVKPSEELSEDEKQLDIKTKVVDGKELKWAVGEANTEEQLPEFDVSLLETTPKT